jgi:DegV family protein with EDD domain
MTIRIVTDSTCDLPAEVISRYGIKVVPLYINVGKQEYLDGIDITREEFYTRLPDFPTHPTTAVPSPLKFKTVYDSLAEEGATEVISIHISEALSAVVNVAKLAAKETVSTAVTVLDGHQLSLGTGFLVEAAAKMASLGHSVEEIMSSLLNQIKRSHVFAALDTLEYLKRSGRMNRFVSSIGTLLQLKPILTMWNGKPGNEKVRTTDKALKRLVEMLAALGPLEKVALVHTHAPEKLIQLRKMAENLLPKTPIMVEDITPVIGAHIGPGAVGFAAIKVQE